MTASGIAPDMRTGLRVLARAGFAWVGLWVVVGLVVVVMTAAEFSARQPATVALDVGLSVMRLVLPIFSILLVQELLTRELERKSFLIAFTYPRPRSLWLAGRLAAILLVLAAMLILMSGLLALLVNFVARGYPQTTPVALGLPYLVTLLFASVDLLVVVGMATLIALSTTTPSFVLIGTLGFLLIARSYMPIVQLLQNAEYLVDKFADPRLYKSSLNALNFVLPDLGTMDIRMVALYGKLEFMPPQWPILLASALVYAVALFCVAVWRLNSREYS